MAVDQTVMIIHDHNLIPHDLYELTKEDECALRRMYRTLRIRVASAPPGEYAGTMYYGMSREDAKAAILPLASELNWHTYLGSK